MPRMKSDSSTGRITVSGIRDDVLDALDDLAESEEKSRSEKVVELIEAEVAETVPDEDGAYLPMSGELREIYTASLDVASMPAHTLRFDIRGGQLAQAVGVGKQAVRAQLFRLQHRGYVRHQPGQDASHQNREFYRVKPRCANPKVWRYSKVRDLDAVRQLESHDSESTSDHLDELTGAQPEAAD